MKFVNSFAFAANAPKEKKERPIGVDTYRSAQSTHTGPRGKTEYNEIFCQQTRGPNVQGSCNFIRLLHRVIIQNYSLVEEFFSEEKEMTLDAAEHP